LGKQEDRMKKWKHCIDSMTQEEKENPELLEKQTSRLQRIAKGSGCNTSDIRALIKQYKMLKEFIQPGKNVDMNQGIEGISQKQLQKLGSEEDPSSIVTVTGVRGSPNNVRGIYTQYSIGKFLWKRCGIAPDSSEISSNNICDF